MSSPKALGVVLVALVAVAGCARSRPAVDASAHVDDSSWVDRSDVEISPPTHAGARPSIEHWLAYDGGSPTCGTAAPARRRAAVSGWGPDIDPFASAPARDVWLVSDAPQPICRRTVTIGRGWLSPEGVWADAEPERRRGRR